MRIRTLHPSLLDTRGLVAVRRESLLAQKVLQGLTKGYTHHPQLLRFQKTSNPLTHIAYYLSIVAQSASMRGYHFDHSKIGPYKESEIQSISVTEDQVAYERQRLLQKIQQRDNKGYNHIKDLTPQIHPLFSIISGPIEPREKVSKYKNG